MLHVQCRGCLTTAYVSCTCQPEILAAGLHHPVCAMANIDASVICPSDSDCCQESHDHAAHAASCATDHAAEGHDCATPGSCPVWRNAKADEHRELRKTGQDVPDCPGGHCGLGVTDCAVCRPLIITLPPGDPTQVTLADSTVAAIMGGS